MNRILTFCVIMLALVGCGDDDGGVDATVDATNDMTVADDVTLAEDATPDATDDATPDATVEPLRDGFWIANRASGVITRIAPDNSVETIALPNEPMYANYHDGLVYVGDRANDNFHVVDARTGDILQSVPVAEGVFHQWVGTMLIAVNADVARETHVFDIATLTSVGVIAMPTDLAATADAKPHDVFVAADDSALFVTYIGFDASSVVVRFAPDANDDWVETHRVDVGGDAHLLMTDGKLFVPCQESANVFILNPADLTVITTLDAPGAHGISAANGKVYVGNISDADQTVVTVIDVASDAVVSTMMVRPPAEATGSPHNLAFNADGSRLAVTHSGGDATWVSMYTISGNDVVSDGAVDVRGLNPFGLTFVPAN